MFSHLRKRISYTGVIMTFALVFAMSGGAYAASKYLITSTKQISPKVLSALRGKSGPRGATGTAGPTGQNGAPGAAGQKGAPGTPGLKGEPGEPGQKGEKGAEGLEGPPGSPWTAGGVLPTGATETGSFVAGPNTGTSLFTGVSFPIQLSEALDAAHVATVMENETVAHCPGTEAEPTAEAGYLCVYLGATAGAAKSVKVEKLTFGGGASKTGAIMIWEFESGVTGVPVFGSFAVTGK